MYQTTQLIKDDVNEVVDCNISGPLPPMAPHLLRTCQTAWCMTRWFPAIMMTLKWLSKWGFSAKGVQSESDAGKFWTLNWKPVFGSGIATSYRGWRLWQTSRRILPSLHQNPVHVNIKASLARRNIILKKLWGKGKCVAVPLQHCLTAELIRDKK